SKSEERALGLALHSLFHCSKLALGFGPRHCRDRTPSLELATLPLESAAENHTDCGSCCAAAFGADTGVSQPNTSSASPVMISKNCLCISAVIGPRRPAATCTLSTERIGVISAAVPVKNTSSAM